MSKPYNTYLRGLLGLLDAKVGGRSPDSFEDSIRLTLDSLQFMLAQRRETLFIATAAFSTTGFKTDAAAAAVVPSTEMWMFDNYAVNSGTALIAAEELLMYPAYRARSNAGVNTTQILGQMDRVALALDLPISTNWRPFILLPGDILGVYAQRAVTAATFTVNMMASFIRVSI